MGKVNRLNQSLEMFLRCSVQDQPKKWKSWLPLAELWYKSSFHSALGGSPFKTLHGHEANMDAMPPDSPDPNSLASDILLDIAAQLASFKQHLATVQNRMKLKADRNRTKNEFQVG